jgi:cystathionine beta-lyase/cystathionine gamma-synthase
VAERPIGDGTRVVHAGLPEPRQHEPLLPGPQPASLYHLRGEPSGTGHEYGRYTNPTWSRWEAALGELERAAHHGAVELRKLAHLRRFFEAFTSCTASRKSSGVSKLR